MRVLITDFSSYKAIVVAQFIQQHYPSIAIITCDHRQFTRVLRSRYTSNHHVINCDGIDSEAYPEKLAEIVLVNKIDLLIPVNSKELEGLLEERDIFNGALDYWGSIESYRCLHDKALLHAKLREIGVAIPLEFPDLVSARAPVVIKPTNSSASKGVKYLMTDSQIKDYIVEHGSNLSGHVIQSYIAGDGAGYSGYFDEHLIVSGYGHLRLVEFPISGGSSVYRGPLSKSYVVQCQDVVKNILEHINWSGFAMFEFKLANDGTVVFIECNPRIWGSLHQGLANGCNYFRELLGPPEIELCETRESKLTYLSPLLWGSFLSHIFRLEFAKLRSFILNSRRNYVDVSLIKDPGGWLSLLGRILS